MRLSRLPGSLRGKISLGIPGTGHSLPRTFIMGNDSFERFMSRTGFVPQSQLRGLAFRSNGFLAMPLPDDLEIRMEVSYQKETDR